MLVAQDKAATPMNAHHLVLGKLKDFLTGEILDDTLDERYRQKIARILVTAKGFDRRDIQTRRRLLVAAGSNKARIKIDFLVSVDGRPAMVIKFGPGSLVTRRRAVLAASRLLAHHQIPVAVVTNGEDAEILDGATGKVLARGLEGIPSRPEMQAMLRHNPAIPIGARRAELESRILYCYEVDDRCPCDEDICRL